MVCHQRHLNRELKKGVSAYAEATKISRIDQNTELDVKLKETGANMTKKCQLFGHVCQARQRSQETEPQKIYHQQEPKSDTTSKPQCSHRSALKKKNQVTLKESQRNTVRL